MDGLEYLKTTAALMSELRIAVRDTFSFDFNSDDFYANGGKYDGPRHFKIEWVETDGRAETKSKSIYEIPGRRSAAYDATTIVAPVRFKASGRDDHLVHECVHFLQHNTVEEDRQYIHINNGNYVQYLAQRVELEAHLIQVAYLSRGYSEHWNSHLDEDSKSAVTTVLDKVRQGEPPGFALPTLLMCKSRGLL